MQSKTRLAHNKHTKMTKLAIFLLLLVAVLFFASKYLGTRYASQMIEDRLQESGMSPLVHYKSISFNPLTLTPTMHSVAIGNPNRPWLTFNTVAFHYLPISYPKLDIEFVFDDSEKSHLARDTQTFMAAAGIQTLTGHGHILSTPKGNNIDSYLSLNIENIGTLTLNSNLDLLNPDFSLHEFRSDLLASIALGQLEAMPILYGDSVAFHKLTLHFQDDGVTQQLWPKPKTPAKAEERQIRLKLLIDKLGIATYNSPQNRYISNQIIEFTEQPNQLMLAMTPTSSEKLARLMQWIQVKSLYQNSGMYIYAK